VATLTTVKLTTLVMAVAPTTLAVSPVTADPSWRIDLSARGISSVELASASNPRDGLVPAFGARALRRVGPVHVGGSIGAGFPAWYAKADAAVSIDHETVRRARWALTTGLDAGVGLFYFDAPPETPPSSDALIYWGPLVRARVQLHVLTMLPSSRAIGVVVGANAAVTAARYTGTASDSGVRLEPELEVGLTMRL
jgi:hypothetical protein